LDYIQAKYQGTDAEILDSLPQQQQEEQSKTEDIQHRESQRSILKSLENDSLQLALTKTHPRQQEDTTQSFQNSLKTQSDTIADDISLHKDSSQLKGKISSDDIEGDNHDDQQSNHVEKKEKNPQIVPSDSRLQQEKIASSEDLESKKVIHQKSSNSISKEIDAKSNQLIISEETASKNKETCIRDPSQQENETQSNDLLESSKQEQKDHNAKDALHLSPINSDNLQRETQHTLAEGELSLPSSLAKSSNSQVLLEQYNTEPHTLQHTPPIPRIPSSQPNSSSRLMNKLLCTMPCFFLIKNYVTILF